MELFRGLNTDIGIIKGRDGIFLDEITFNGESELTLIGGFSYNKGEKKFEMTFKGIVYIVMIHNSYAYENLDSNINPGFTH